MSTPPALAGGIPADAVAFYAELVQHNERAWFQAHKERYAASVREPLVALTDALAGEFGEPKVFRPQRNLRFSADKTPYKDSQGAILQVIEGLGYYVSVGPDGLTTGGGMMHLSPDQLVRFRSAVDAAGSGERLAKVVDSLRRKGFGIGGEVLKSRPRGVPADHPRVDLLAHKSLIVWVDHGTPAWMSTPQVVAKVRAQWRLVRPVVEWVAEHVGDAEQPHTSLPR